MARLEPLEDRTLLSVSAALDGSNDAVITGSNTDADFVTMLIENQGLANETLRISDPAGVTAGAGFTQDGPNSATVLTSAITGLNININTLGASDEVNITATPAGLTTNVETAGGIDSVFVGSTTSFNTGASTLDGILGLLNVTDSGGACDLYVDDSGDPVARNVTFTSSSIVGAAPAMITWNLGVDRPSLALGTSGDTVNVQSTQAIDVNPPITTIFGNQGSDTFNITAGDLDFANIFNGGEGVDTFNLDLAAGANITAGSVRINGDSTPAATQRDRVNITANDPALRVVSFNNGTGQGEVDVDGLGTTIQIGTVETVRYRDSGNNDVATVTGTANDDLITVAPLSASRALVFDGGNPWQGPPADFATSFPGVAGGSLHPDLDLGGLDTASSLTIQDAGGANDRLIIYGQSETALTDGSGTNYFGFGAGVILPGVGAGNAFDTIAVSDTQAAVNGFVRVNYNNVDFVQPNPDTQPAIVVNSGFEGNPPLTTGTDVADDITVNLSAAYRFQINGGDPDPATTGIVPPDGDRLQLNAPAGVTEINIFSDKSSAPTIEFVGALPFGSSSIESLYLNASAGTTVNLIGDNNNTTPQTDNFVVVGQDVDADPSDGGYQEMAVSVNGNAPISINNVAFLDVVGYELVDTLELTPYADDTPRGWGIDVSYDEGNPTGTDGDQADLLIYNTSVFGGNASENIVVQPSGPDNGEVRVTNATDGSAIVTINYVANTDIIVNDNDGSLSDTDTLTLRGTSGQDLFQADFTNAGDVANPLVTVTDQNSSDVLYRLRDLTNISTITLEGLEGSDTIHVTPIPGLPVFVDGGDPIGEMPGDTLAVSGVGAVTLFGGPENDEGGVQIGANATVSYDHIETLSVGGGGPVVVMGTNGNDVITVIARDSDYSPMADGIQDWTISINAGPALLFIDQPTVTVNALSGNDEIVIIQRDPDPTTAPAGAWGVDVTVDGGQPPAGSDQVIVGTPNGTDVVTYSPTDSDSATFVNTTQNSTVIINNVEHTIYDGQGGGDSLTVETPAGGDEIFLTPGALFDQGSLTMRRFLAAGGGQLLPLNFEDLGNGSLTLSDAGQTRSDELTVNGTAASNIISVNSGGQIDLDTRGPSGGTIQTLVAVNTPGISFLNLSGLDGDDTFNVPGNHPFTGGVQVDGGDPSASDVLNIGGGGAAITVNLAAESVTETGFAPVSTSGVETVNIAAAAAELTVNGTADDDTITYHPTGATAGTFSNDGQNTVYNFTSVGTTATAEAFTINVSGDVADRVILVGTNNHDVITIDSAARTAIVQNAAGTDLKQVTLGASVEILTAQGLLGNDTFIVSPAAGVGAGLLVEVDGGLPGASDALVIAQPGGEPLAATDFVVINKGRNPNEGVVRVFRSGTQLPDISYSDTEIVSPNVFVDPETGNPQLLVMGPDLYEENEFRTNAAFLGSGDTINVDNLAIFPNVDEHPFVPADIDWFQFVARETGTLDFQIYFEQYDPTLLPAGGNINIEVYDADGLPAAIAGVGSFGNADATPNARVRIPAVAGQTYFLRVFGADAAVVNAYEMTVINTPAPVPYDIELDDLPPDPAYDCTMTPPSALNSDTGRSQFDNVTCDASPEIVIRLDDALLLQDLPGNPVPDTPPDEVIPIPFNPSTDPDDTTAGYRVAVFIEGDPQQPGQEPQVLVGFATLTAVNGVYTFDFDDAFDGAGLTLTDGSHFISAKVQIIDPADPAQSGFGARSDSLEIVVDTTPPPVFFGDPSVDNDGIDPADTDTGIEGQPDTFVDRITSDTGTGFWGTAEADAIVRVYADQNADGQVDPGDVLLGLTVAVPLDGTNQFPNGQWNLTTNVDLNDPAFFTIDGVRHLLVTAEDVAGNVSESQQLDIFIDTQGPRVAAVNDPDGESVFDPKPTDGPSPLMPFIDILFTDEPVRVGESIIVGDDAVFVIDVSGSTSGSFVGSAVGDVNNDGSSDTILDAEIAAFIALNQQLIALGLGDVSNVSVVPFGSGASSLDMDPVAPDVQLSTTPNADADANGTPDVEDVLRSLTSGGGTNFEAALQEAITTIGAVGTAPGNGNVVFLSDGFGSGDFADEVATLQAIPINLRAFGVGTGSDLSQLLTMDPMAMQFTSTDELLGVFGGGGGGNGGGATGFVYPAVNEILATTPGNYQLVGDSTGVVLITQVTFLDMTVSGDIGRTTVRLHFAEPLPDDRYTLTVFDRIQDRAGNALDGDVQASAPGVDVQLLPSGDGVPGEDFTARFTVDSRPEIGTYAHFNVYLDINGNFTFDPTNADAVNRDIVFKIPLTELGVTAEAIFAGNFSPVGAAAASGFDKLGAYGKIDGLFRWLLDFDHDGVADLNVVSGLQINGLPVAGDFNAAHPGDEIGLFDGFTWYLDTNANNNIDSGDTVISGDLRGFPIVGDFDGDGLDDLATWQYDQFRFSLAADGLTGNTGHTIDFGFPGVLERPVAADMNQDGIDDIGLYVPSRDGVLPRDGAEWYFLISDRPLVDEGAGGVGTVDALNHPFEPVPFGTDLFAQFGDDLAIPIVGNFDPPAPTTGAPPVPTAAAVFRNGLWFFDTDGAGGAAEKAYAFGIPGDVPVTGDFNRDGADEAAVFRNGTWFFDLDGTGGMAEAAFAFGIPGDVPVTGDFNGDGAVDAGVFRDGTWFIDTDGAGGAAEIAFAFGAPGDVPVTGDFNRDGRTDAAVFRNGLWFFDLDGQGQAAEHALAYGIGGDVPVTGDFNGDGKTDVGVMRGNLWFLDLNDDGGLAERVITFGADGDVPLTARLGFGMLPPVNQPAPPPPMMSALASLSSDSQTASATDSVDQAIEELTTSSAQLVPVGVQPDTQNQTDTATQATGEDDLDQPLIDLLDTLGGL